MKVRNSLKSLRSRHRDNRLVRRKGRVYIIKNAAKSAALAAAVANTIDAVTKRAMKQGEGVTVISDGQKTWHVIAVV